MTQQQFERLLYQKAGADRQTAKRLATNLYFHTRRRWLLDWAVEWVRQMGEEADAIERRDIGYGKPEEAAAIERRAADIGGRGYTGLEDTTENPPPRPSGPKKRYVMRGFDWWSRFCESKQEPQ